MTPAEKTEAIRISIIPAIFIAFLITAAYDLRPRKRVNPIAVAIIAYVVSVAVITGLVTLTY